LKVNYPPETILQFAVGVYNTQDWFEIISWVVICETPIKMFGIVIYSRILDSHYLSLPI
jgi:hypothetical protein